MIVPILLGGLAGAGVLLIVAAMFPTRPGLAAELNALDQPNWPTPGTGTDGRGAPGSFGATLNRVFGLELRSLEVDLRVTGRTAADHTMERVKTAGAFGSAPVIFGLFLPYVGGFGAILSPSLLILGSVLLAGFGWVLTDTQLRARATARRREFQSGLVTYLGLVSTLTAAGSGIDEALWLSVEQGRGWAFQVIRRALSDARNRGETPWAMMHEYALRLDLPALGEFAGTMQLSGTSGAQLRTTVMTKAKSLRMHQLSAIEREAMAKTSAMAGPTGLMMAGFVTLLLFPAVVAVLSL